MFSITNTQNSIALQLLQSTSHSSANSGASARHSDPASIIGAISSGSDATNSPVTKALAEITRISLESGGEAISAGDDAKVTGTDFADYIIAGRGSTINGGDGDDFIVAGWGSTVNGGAGDDTIRASGSIASGSVVHGGDGDDTIFAGGEVYGGAGNDTIQGGGNIYGGEGNDKIHGTDSGGMQNSTISGGLGDDRILALGENTTAHGDEGNDFVRVSGGAMGYGGEGNDSMHLGATGGTVEGGKGNDLITFQNTAGKDSTSTAKFNKGDGKDYLQSFSSDVVLEFGQDLFAENMNIEYLEEGEKVVITFDGSENDQITLVNLDNENRDTKSSFTIKFADGTKQEIDVVERYSKTTPPEWDFSNGPIQVVRPNEAQ